MMAAVRIFVARLEKLLSLLLVAPALRCSGLRVGRRVAFFGLPIVERAAGTTIEIGDRTVLASRSGMTPLGIAHPTILRTLAPGAYIRIGRDVGMSGTVICAAAGVEIGDGTMFGADCRVVDTDFHPVRSAERRYAPIPEPSPADRVCIGRNVFLGMSVQVLKGVTIGDDTVVAAASVVVHDLPARTVCAGNPARPVRELELDERPPAVPG